MKRRIFTLLFACCLIFCAGIFLTSCGKNNLKINFDSNGGSYCHSLTYKKGDSLSLPNPTREGYLFAGWFEDDELWQNEFDQEKLSDFKQTVTFYAKWIKKVNLVFFNTNCDDVFLDNFDVTLPQPTREGYDFVGWYCDLNLTQVYTTKTIVKENEQNEVYLYAKWRASQSKEKTIYYISKNTEYVIEKATEKVEPYGSVDLYLPQNPYFEFCGWYFDENLTNPAPMRMKNEFLDYEYTNLYGDFRKKEIKSAEIVGDLKLEYEYGEEFDTSGIKLLVEFTENRFENIYVDVTPEMVQGFQSTDQNVYISIFDEGIDGYKGWMQFSIIYNGLTLITTKQYQYKVNTDIESIQLSEDNLQFEIGEKASLAEKYLSITWVNKNGESGSENLVDKWLIPFNYNVSGLNTDQLGNFEGQVRFHFKYLKFNYTVVANEQN